MSLTAFLAVLALLAGQMSASAARVRGPHIVLLRKLVRTTVVETITGGTGATSVSRSQSSSVSGGSAPAAPVTRSS